MTRHPRRTVVQQTVVVDGRRRKQPFILRGAMLSNGRKVPGSLFTAMVGAGFTLLLIGIVFANILETNMYSTVPWLMVLGVALFVPGCYLLLLARHQYNALPSDHPDRYEYGSGYRLPVNTDEDANTYSFHPGEQVVNSTTASVGSDGRYLAPNAGQYGVYPSQVITETTYPLPVPEHVDYHPVVHPVPPAAPPSTSYRPSAPTTDQYVDDPPPSYSEATKNTVPCNQYYVV